MLYVMVAWVFFRSSNLSAAHHVLAAMFGFGAAPVAGSPELVKARFWIWLGALLAFVWWLPNTMEIMGRNTRLASSSESQLQDRVTTGWRRWFRWQMNSPWACLAGLLLAFSILGLSRAGEFLYYNF